MMSRSVDFALVAVTRRVFWGWTLVCLTPNHFHTYMNLTTFIFSWCTRRQTIPRYQHRINLDDLFVIGFLCIE